MKRILTKERLWNVFYEIVVIILALSLLVSGICLLMNFSEPSREFFLKCLPLLEKAVWPYVLMIILFVFHGEVKRALSELPGFVHRSNYGSYGGGDSVDGKALESLRYCDFENAFYVTGNSRVKTVVERMSKADFSYAPLVNGRRCIEKVFSINRFLENLIAHPEMGIPDDLTMDKLSFGLEDTLGFAFCSPGMSVSALRAHYAFAWENGDEFKPVFITEGGRRDGEIVGIATFWDSYLRK